MTTLAGKQVVIYKAGQSAAGGRAAMGHTASIAGDYEVCLSVLTQAGALVATDVSEFSDLFYISDCMRDKIVRGKRLGAVAGAGYDTVAIADSIQVGDFSMSVATISASTRERLVAILAAKKLDALMEVRNPFDINPGADDEVHLLCTEAMAAEPEVDSVVVGLDPTSPMVRSLKTSARSGFDIDSPQSIVQTLPALVASCAKPIVAFIDGGPLFDPMADKLMEQGVCIFRSSERAARSLERKMQTPCSISLSAIGSKSGPPSMNATMGFAQEATSAGSVWTMLCGLSMSKPERALVLSDLTMGEVGSSPTTTESTSGSAAMASVQSR